MKIVLITAFCILFFMAPFLNRTLLRIAFHKQQLRTDINRISANYFRFFFSLFFFMHIIFFYANMWQCYMTQQSAITVNNIVVSWWARGGVKFNYKHGCYQQANKQFNLIIIVFKQLHCIYGKLIQTYKKFFIFDNILL